jgi:dynein heavy chain
MIILDKEKKEAEQYQKIVQEEELEATKQAAEAMSIAKEVDEKVSEANSRLQESLKAVSMLQTPHLVEMKSLKSPPKTTVIVLGGCVVFFQDIILKELGGEIVMKKIEGTIKKEEDWITTARLYLLENPKNFL